MCEAVSGCIGLSSSARDCQITWYFELSRSQIIQPICVFNLLHQPEVSISRIFGRDNHPKISRASLQNILLLVQCVFTSPKTHTMQECQAKYLELISQARVSSFEVKSQADEDVICNFRFISQIRNSGLFGNLQLMRTGLLTVRGLSSLVTTRHWWATSRQNPDCSAIRPMSYVCHWTHHKTNLVLDSRPVTTK